MTEPGDTSEIVQDANRPQNHINEESPVQSLHSNTNITDLTIDCLEEIFEYLDLPDLLNIADSHKRLNKAAAFVYIRRHRKWVVFKFWPSPPDMVINKQFILIKDIDTFHRFLRCFSHSISVLEIINFKSNILCCYKGVCIQSFRYIVEYCAQFLVKLRIRGYCHNIFDIAHKPFTRLVSMSIEYCVLDLNQTLFRKWFPRLRRLNLRNIKIIEYVDTNTKIFFKHWDLKCAADMREYFQRLDRLIIVGRTLKSYTEHHITSFYQLEDLLEDEISSDPRNVLKKMQENFIRNVHLEYSYSKMYMEIKLLNVTNQLPSLCEINVSVANFNGFFIEQAIRFMTEYKQLNKCKFTLSKCEANNLLTQIHEEWRVLNVDAEAEAHIVTLERYTE